MYFLPINTAIVFRYEVTKETENKVQIQVDSKYVLPIKCTLVSQFTASSYKVMS